MIKKATLGLFFVLILFVLLVGCNAPVCYPPNTIIGNKCCLDDNKNSACDYDEKKESAEPEEDLSLDNEEDETEETAEETKETIREEPAKKTTIIKSGSPAKQDTLKQNIAPGEPRQYLEINELKAYRSSTDKGVIDEMTYTVRNIGKTKITPTVDLMFDNHGIDFTEKERIREYELTVMKNYDLVALEPGEKLVIKQLLGIRFQGINETKTLQLSIYDRNSAPRKDIQVLRREILPTKYFSTMDIQFYGPEEEFN
jgi:hypothetical protein